MLWFMELTPWSGVTLGRLRYLINSPHFAEFGSNYHVLKDLLIFPDLLHLNPAHCLPSYFFKTHLNIFLPFLHRSYKWSLSFRSSNQTLYVLLSFYVRYMSHPPHPPWFDHPIAICGACDRGFDSWLCHWNFSLTSLFRLHYGPGVDSGSNRNEYQEYFLGGKGGWCIGLTTLPPSCADCLEIWEPQPPGTLRACLGLY